MRLSYPYPACHSGEMTEYREAFLEPVQLEEEPYEVFISTQGLSFHVIFGSHSYGHFLCIPNWSVSCELGDYSDQFWNKESLLGVSEQIDYPLAAAIVKGVALASRSTEI